MATEPTTEPTTALVPVVRPSIEELLDRDPTAAGKFCGQKKRVDKETGLPRHGDPRQKTCTRPAGWGTDHIGRGSCKLHGGASATGMRSGKGTRYSTAMRPHRIGALIEEFEADPDPLNILPELAAARALFADFINRHEEFSEALLAWWASWEATRVPLPPEKLAAFTAVVDDWEKELKTLPSEASPRQLKDLSGARAYIALLAGKDGSNPRPRQILDIADADQLLQGITKIVERIEAIRAQNAISRADFVRLTAAMASIVQRYVTDPNTLRSIGNDWRDLAF